MIDNKMWKKQIMLIVLVKLTVTKSLSCSTKKRQLTLTHPAVHGIQLVFVRQTAYLQNKNIYFKTQFYFVLRDGLLLQKSYIFNKEFAKAWHGRTARRPTS
jgi:hypothetical protein